MRVGVDARFITRLPRRGIGNYSLHLIRELVELAPHISFFLYISAEDLDGVLPISSNVTVRRLAMTSYPLWEQLCLPRASAADKVDILHCLGNTAPLRLPGSVKLVLTLHDVMFLRSGVFVPRPTNSYQTLGRFYRQVVVPSCALIADAVITVSEYSRNDILSAIQGLGPEAVHVTHESCDPAFIQNSGEALVLANPSQTRPYLLALGADDPRKNTQRLVLAYLSLLEEYDIEEDLVISGYTNWKSSEAYRLVVKADATQRVRFLSYVSLDELAMLYRNARLFVYPSLYEGFGIPLLEAFSSGCPVVASNVTSIPEVAGNAAFYVDPNSQDEIAEAIFRLLHDDELRISLSASGHKRAEQFSWRETARKTLSIYESCITDMSERGSPQ